MFWRSSKRPDPTPPDTTPLFRKYYSADVPVALETLTEFRGDAFPRSGPECWIDAPDALFAVDRKVSLGELSDSDAEMCRKFITQGFYVAEKLIDHETLDRSWREYESAIERGDLSVPAESHGDDDPYPGRVLDPHLLVPGLRNLQWHPEVLRITDILFGRKTLPFQTIIGHKGSAQSAHSDAIHMTTYPLGFLIANWIAFEDIHPDSGPLFYYPKSHRILPYLLSFEVGIEPLQFKNGLPVYSEKYEPALQRYLDAYELKPETFIAKKGDVFFWHANLVHGGSKRVDLRRSRKALVCHYFGERVFAYHDLSGNASRLHRNGVYADASVDPPV